MSCHRTRAMLGIVVLSALALTVVAPATAQERPAPLPPSSTAEESSPTIEELQHQVEVLARQLQQVQAQLVEL